MACRKGFQQRECRTMKTTPYFLIAAIASFIFTYCVFAAASDDQGVEHWMAQQTSSIAAMSGGNG
jgi:hypothetical protein